jgi:AAA domain
MGVKIDFSAGEHSTADMDTLGAAYGQNGLDQQADVSTEADRRYLDLLTRVVDVGKLGEIPPPAPLVEGWLFRDSVAWLHGKPGHFKTFVAVDLACCVAAGVPWHGREVKQGTVLYVAAEGVSGMADRIDAWGKADPTEPVPSKIKFLTVPVQMMQPLDLATFAMVAKVLQPIVIVIDTRGAPWGRMRTHRATWAGLWMRSKIFGCSAARASWLSITSLGTLRIYGGSTALEGGADSILQVSRHGYALDLSNPKQKNAPEMAVMRLHLHFVGKSAVVSDLPGVSNDLENGSLSLTASEEAILKVMRLDSATSEVSKSEPFATCAMIKGTFYRSLNSLIRKRRLRERKSGKSSYISLNVDQQDPLIN